MGVVVVWMLRWCAGVLTGVVGYQRWSVGWQDGPGWRDPSWCWAEEAFTRHWQWDEVGPGVVGYQRPLRGSGYKLQQSTGTAWGRTAACHHVSRDAWEGSVMATECRTTGADRQRANRCRGRETAGGKLWSDVDHELGCVIVKESGSWMLLL